LAETFKNVVADLGTTATTAVYTCPSATTAIVIHCQVANVDGTNDADLSMALFDNSATADAAIVSTLLVPADGAVNPIGGKLVLEASDQLRASANATGDLEITIGVLEIT
jgi:hypothetical protein|tara:strand:+ start:569 stop:898 length:330 start_codon:yes stop_codon:yes gene_type:complete